MTSSLRNDPAVAWQLAGLTSFVRGLVGTDDFPFGTHSLPGKARVEDGRLLTADRELRDFDSTGLLDAFVRIETEDDITRFATRWGTLWICAHGYPSSHADRYVPVWRTDDPEWSPSDSKCFPKDWSGEPVERWFVYVTVARSILNIAAALHSGKLGEGQDWVQAFAGFDMSDEIRQTITPTMWEGPVGKLENATVALADLINEWLRLGDVRPRLDWELSGPHLEFDCATFGVVGIQLLQAVTRAHGLTICSSCGKPYLRQGRKAPRGRRNYCPDCGEGAALRDAQRAHRQRRKSDGPAS
jgi:hypothetical protein